MKKIFVSTLALGALMTAGQSATLISEFDFNGNALNNVVGNGNGTIVGSSGSYVSTPFVPNVQTDNYDFMQHYYFFGSGGNRMTWSNDTVKNSLTSSSDFTVTAWVDFTNLNLNNASDTNSMNGIFGTGWGSSNTNGFALGLKKTTDGTALAFTAKGTQWTEYLSPNVDQTGWNNVAYVYNGTANSADLYVNAAYIGSIENITPWNTASTLVIGAMSNDSLGAEEYFKGGIDEVKIYDGILTPNEIRLVTHIANEPTPVPEPMTATLSLLALAGLLKRRR